MALPPLNTLVGLATLDAHLSARSGSVLYEDNEFTVLAAEMTMLDALHPSLDQEEMVPALEPLDLCFSQGGLWPTYQAGTRLGGYTQISHVIKYPTPLSDLADLPSRDTTPAAHTVPLGNPSQANACICQPSTPYTPISICDEYTCTAQPEIVHANVPIVSPTPIRLILPERWLDLSERHSGDLLLVENKESTVSPISISSSDPGFLGDDESVPGAPRMRSIPLPKVEPITPRAVTFLRFPTPVEEEGIWLDKSMSPLGLARRRTGMLRDLEE